MYSGGALKATVTGTSATVTGLVPSTSYSFSVVAVDNAGNVSAQQRDGDRDDARAPRHDRAFRPDGRDCDRAIHDLDRRVVDGVYGCERHQGVPRVLGRRPQGDGHRHLRDRHRPRALDVLQLLGGGRR